MSIDANADSFINRIELIKDPAFVFSARTLLCQRMTWMESNALLIIASWHFVQGIRLLISNSVAPECEPCEFYSKKIQTHLRTLRMFYCRLSKWFRCENQYCIPSTLRQSATCQRSNSIVKNPVCDIAWRKKIAFNFSSMNRKRLGATLPLSTVHVHRCRQQRLDVSHSSAHRNCWVPLRFSSLRASKKKN